MIGVQQEACKHWRERLPGEVRQAGNPEALLYPQVLMRQSYSRVTYPEIPLPWENSSCVSFKCLPKKHKAKPKNLLIAINLQI